MKRTNKKLIIQACLTVDGTGIFDAGFSGCMHDMLRLTYQRHAAYARSHNYDYWHIMGSVYPDMIGGGWDKIELIRRALEAEYEFVAWVDADAAVLDFEHDLTEALTVGEFGACVHDPARSEYLKMLNVPAHCNVGVTYWRNTELTRKFVAEWFATYPGEQRWKEQGSFNELIKRPEYAAVFETCADTWNATVNVNEVTNPIVKGWHGIVPAARRMGMMKAELSQDFLVYRI